MNKNELDKDSGIEFSEGVLFEKSQLSFPKFVRHLSCTLKVN